MSQVLFRETSHLKKVFRSLSEILDHKFYLEWVLLNVDPLYSYPYFVPALFGKGVDNIVLARPAHWQQSGCGGVKARWTPAVPPEDPSDS